MRKIIFQNLISIDGYYEGPNREIDWHNVDAEFNDFAIAFLSTIDTIIFGSSDLALSFIPYDLIDEFRILINPVVLGSGKPLFQGLKERLKLKLLKTKIFNSGNVLLYYIPVRN